MTSTVPRGASADRVSRRPADRRRPVAAAGRTASWSSPPAVTAATALRGPVVGGGR
ncbi:hypothetical protein MRQ36_24900 [Micromonospora sp. R77]|uniref:hypothetical protein n=1 Tax=Micromonospora sp. R77 TaxID=2925836 RepID=UPI001F5FFFB2|nr:hypothetical protein [Micromonospora sp. R77]MCI4065625.1 hypothetical protein [Micromonospora sp. R77]